MSASGSVGSIDYALETADLTRKLQISTALLSYQHRCTETRALEAAEEERKLRAKITYLQPQNEALFAGCVADERHIQRLEDLIRQLGKKLQWHIARRKSLGEAVRAYQARTVNLEGELEKVKSDIQKSSTRLTGEKTGLESQLAETKKDLIATREKQKWFETELEKCAVEKLELDWSFASQSTEIIDLKKEIAEMKESRKKALETDMKHLEALKEFTKKADETERKLIGERQTLEREVASLEHLLETEKKATQRIAETVSKQGEGIENSKKELAELRATLKKETKAKEKAQTDLEKSKSDWEARQKVLETKLESTRNKLKTTRESMKTETSKVPLLDNPPKNDPLTMEDLEHSVQKKKRAPQKTSEFSITPFLKRQAAMMAHTPEVSSGGDSTIGQDSEVGERSIMLPSVIESNEPTRILLAGASRKRKNPKPVPEEPLIPEVSEEEEEQQLPTTAADAAANSETESLSAPAPKPKRQRKNPPKPRAEPKKKPISRKKTPQLDPKPNLEPHSSLFSSPPPNGEPEAEAEAKEPSLLQPPPSPPPPSAVGEKKKRKRKLAPQGPSGINPSLFTEDDGTGRLELNIEGGDNHPSTVAEGAKTNAKGKGKGSGKAKGKGNVEGGDMMQAVPVLVPKVSMFSRDISPAKKRPDALKGLFGKK